MLGSWQNTKQITHHLALQTGQNKHRGILDNLSKIFYFLNDMAKVTRNSLLADAWKASIKLSEKPR